MNNVIMSEKVVYKDHKVNNRMVCDVIKEFTEPKKILIVFWHGLGDLLMFAPLYNLMCQMFPVHQFDLSVLPGVGQCDIVKGALELPEENFVKDHDTAFVMSFPMVEGAATMTKMEYCCIAELGIAPVYTGLPTVNTPYNRLVGVHFQGTCLPGSTNPDDKLAKTMWDDLVEAGYVPIDLHFEHIFHNPVNKKFDWATRNCRDLQPDIDTLRMLIGRCVAFIGVASGPFVLAASMKKNRTIYLQKNHTIDCYIKDFTNVIDINNYSKDTMLKMLSDMEND